MTNTSTPNTFIHQFVGSWELKQWVVERSDGQTAFPFGEDAQGRIAYDAFGNMSVQIMQHNRPPFSSDDPLEGQPEEVLEAYQSFIAYCGSYEVIADSNQVVHHIEISSFPNWAGQEQRRYYAFTGDTLTLSTDFIGSRRHQLIWEKITY
ncbi:MAG: lipocalin-like domain-containing protein [Saprospiraceae bacterium]|nr:lipocalin-like domain-containing protein [Saprospiraceae bacterium]